MNRVMINVFVKEDVDGLLLLAYAHAIAKRLNAGVHVTYCTDENANQKANDLHQMMKLAKTHDFTQPDKRLIFIADLPIELETMLGFLVFKDVQAFYEGRLWRWIRRLATPFLFLYTEGERRELAVDALSRVFSWLEKRHVK